MLDCVPVLPAVCARPECEIDLPEGGAIIALAVTVRAKLALAGGAAVVLATGAAVAWTRAAVGRRVDAEVRQVLRRAQPLADRGQRLSAMELVALAESLAADAEFRTVLSPALPARDRPRAAFVAIEGHNARLAKAGKKADLMLALGADGKVIARDLDPRALFGDDLLPRFPSISLALSGAATADVWLFDGKMLRVGVAPVRVDGVVAGAIAIAYGVTARDARRERDLYGADVAYFLDGRIHASSLAVPGSVGEGGEAAEDVEKVAAVAGLLSLGGVPDRALATGRPTEILPLRMELQGRRPELYLARVAPIPDVAAGRRAGYVVLGSVTEPLRVAQRAGRVVGLVGLVGLLALVFSVLLLGRRFERSLDRVEVGVSEVISGNLDYTFEAFDEFEGLCNGLNAMLARLLGRPEPQSTVDEDVEAPVPPEDLGGDQSTPRAET